MDLDLEGKIMKRKALESFPSLMQVTSYREFIEMDTTFWDKTRSVFSFGDVEMTPLLEEIKGYHPKECHSRRSSQLIGSLG